MLIDVARAAIKDITNPVFRPILWKSLGLTVALFFMIWLLAEAAISVFLTPILGPWPWLSTAIAWLMGIGMFIGAGFLLAPAAAIFAGFFLDDIAEKVELMHYPEGGAGTPLPVVKSTVMAAKFTLVVIGANLIALMLILLPGINVAIFFIVNGYLLGREYFTFAAMRFSSDEESNLLRESNSTIVLMAGFIIAGFMAVPILNLLTPLFATSVMVHLRQRLAAESEQAAYGRRQTVG